MPIEQLKGSPLTPSYLHGDQLGSTVLITSSTGTKADTYTYDPYGTVTAHTGTTNTNLQYNGQYTDTETGLIYLRARYYDPTTTQFLTLDPLAAVTRARYSYAAGNPLTNTDPTGLDWIQDTGDWAAGFGDTFTLGGTAKVRQWLGADGIVNKCSPFYTWGGRGGLLAEFAPIGGGGDPTRTFAVGPTRQSHW